RDHPGSRWNATPSEAGRTGQGEGHHLLRPVRPREGGARHRFGRRDVPCGGRVRARGREGSRVRDRPNRGAPRREGQRQLGRPRRPPHGTGDRTRDLRRPVRHGGPEGGHGRVRREAAGGVQGQVSPAPARKRKLDPKTANILYHDAAARSYDDKWSISFDDRCVSYVRERAARMLPLPGYDRVLEIGSGTGFFLLNMWQAGFVKDAHATDISPGMLQACGENARRLGCDIKLRTADAEGLPFEDESFDLVVGHAFLHHLPDWERALRDCYRVLAPGGAILFAGEPTRVGDRLAGVAKRATAE